MNKKTQKILDIKLSSNFSELKNNNTIFKTILITSNNHFIYILCVLVLYG